jgi:hypothetical protein
MAWSQQAQELKNKVEQADAEIQSTQQRLNQSSSQQERKDLQNELNRLNTLRNQLQDQYTFFAGRDARIQANTERLQEQRQEEQALRELKKSRPDMYLEALRQRAAKAGSGSEEDIAYLREREAEGQAFAAYTPIQYTGASQAPEYVVTERLPTQEERDKEIMQAREEEKQAQIMKEQERLYAEVPKEYDRKVFRPSQPMSETERIITVPILQYTKEEQRRYEEELAKGTGTEEEMLAAGTIKTPSDIPPYKYGYTEPFLKQAAEKSIIKYERPLSTTSIKTPSKGYYERVESLEDWEKLIEYKSELTKKDLGLGFLNYKGDEGFGTQVLKGFGNVAYYASGLGTAEFGERLALYSGKVFAAGEGIIQSKESRGLVFKEFKRAGKETLKVYDITTPAGIVTWGTAGISALGIAYTKTFSKENVARRVIEKGNKQLREAESLRTVQYYDKNIIKYKLPSEYKVDVEGKSATLKGKATQFYATEVLEPSVGITRVTLPIKKLPIYEYAKAQLRGNELTSIMKTDLSSEGMYGRLRTYLKGEMAGTSDIKITYNIPITKTQAWIKTLTTKKGLYELRTLSRIPTEKEVITHELTHFRFPEWSESQVRDNQPASTINYQTRVYSPDFFAITTKGGYQYSTQSVKLTGYRGLTKLGKKDTYFIRSETTPIGKSTTNVFRGDVLLKTFKSKTLPYIKFTEPIKTFESKEPFSMYEFRSETISGGELVRGVGTEKGIVGRGATVYQQRLTTGSQVMGYEKAGMKPFIIDYELGTKTPSGEVYNLINTKYKYVDYLVKSKPITLSESPEAIEFKTPAVSLTTQRSNIYTVYETSLKGKIKPLDIFEIRNRLTPVPETKVKMKYPKGLSKAKIKAITKTKTVQQTVSIQKPETIISQIQRDFKLTIPLSKVSTTKTAQIPITYVKPAIATTSSTKQITRTVPKVEIKSKPIIKLDIMKKQISENKDVLKEITENLNIQKNITEKVQKNKQVQKQLQAQKTTQKILQEQTQIEFMPSSPSTTSFIKTKQPTPPPPTTPFFWLDFKGYELKQKPSKLPSFKIKSKYRPTLYSVLTGFKAREKGFETMSGLGLRPLRF